MPEEIILSKREISMAENIHTETEIDIAKQNTHEEKYLGLKRISVEKAKYLWL